MKPSLRTTEYRLGGDYVVTITELSAGAWLGLQDMRERSAQQWPAYIAQQCVVGWRDESLDDIMSAHAPGVLTALADAVFELSGIDELLDDEDTPQPAETPEDIDRPKPAAGPVAISS